LYKKFDGIHRGFKHPEEAEAKIDKVQSSTEEKI